MALKLNSPKRRRLSMTSLIDVIFMLLLFFMLSSTFSKFGEIELTGAAPGGATSEAQVRFVQLESERLTLNGQETDLGGIARLLAPIAGGGAKQTVIIALDDKATAQQVVDLLAVLRKIEGVSAMVLEG